MLGTFPEDPRSVKLYASGTTLTTEQLPHHFLGKVRRRLVPHTQKFPVPLREIAVVNPYIQA